MPTPALAPTLTFQAVESQFAPSKFAILKVADAPGPAIEADTRPFSSTHADAPRLTLSATRSVPSTLTRARPEPYPASGTVHRGFVEAGTLRQALTATPSLVERTTL